jgi:NADPH:quinone reductase-like Zn-dependent oxidoreductase
LAGKIEALGSGTSTFAVGDQVFGATNTQPKGKIILRVEEAVDVTQAS